MMAQAILAILLASAIIATFGGRRPSSALSQACACEFRDRDAPTTALAPCTSSKGIVLR